MSGNRLQGNTVVVIGGTSGLGLAGALACLREGANLVAIGRDPDQVQRAQKLFLDTLQQSDRDPRQAHAFAADANHPDTPLKAIQEAQQRFGHIHALYHVAGGSGRPFGDGPLHLLTDEAIEKTLQINLATLVRSNRAAVQAFHAQKTGGAVLNMGSVLGHAPSPAFFTTHVYAAAKAAVEGFTRSCAAYYAPENIRFNVLCPALVATDMAARATTNPEILQFVKTKQPLHRAAPSNPEDLDGAVVFLLSAEARLVTGQIIDVDGGWGVSEGQIPSPAGEPPR